MHQHLSFCSISWSQTDCTYKIWPKVNESEKLRDPPGTNWPEPVLDSLACETSDAALGAEVFDLRLYEFQVREYPLTNFLSIDVSHF